MNKWTIESLKESVSKGDIIKDNGGRIGIIKSIEKGDVNFVRHNETVGSVKFSAVSENYFRFYTPDFVEILPPQEDERVAVYETVVSGSVQACDAEGRIWLETSQMWSGTSRIRKQNRKDKPCGYINVTKNRMEWL